MARKVASLGIAEADERARIEARACALMLQAYECTAAASCLSIVLCTKCMHIRPLVCRYECSGGQLPLELAALSLPIVLALDEPPRPARYESSANARRRSALAKVPLTLTPTHPVTRPYQP